ncbi:MAG: LCP family protein [Clostridiales bacterium]|nr:LCP family protein [Clostridiales bacterium]
MNRAGSKEKQAQQRDGSALPGGILTGVLAVLMLVLDVSIVRSGMIPVKFLVPLVILLLLLVALLGFLTHRTEKRGRFIAGAVIGVLVAAVMVYGLVALNKLTSTLNNITTVSTEVSYVGAYVLTDDEAETLNDLEAETFGILAELDRTSTDGAIEQLDDELDTEITTEEYDGLTDLIDALYSQECRVILLNSAYLDVIAELEGYEDIEDQIREVTSLSVEEETVVYEEVELSDTIFTVYISGVDSRNGLVAKSRSDVNILATVNTETHQILLVSTPRDYYVPLSISNGVKDKLTHAGIYGVSVCVDTMEMLYDTDIDYYLRMSFDGFEDLVDALGGVTVYSDYAFTSYHYSYYYVEGYNEMDGAHALEFARERFAFPTGDRQRGKNQMVLIKAIIDTAIAPDILVKYDSILTAVEDNFETTLPYDLIAGLVNNQLSTGADWDIITYSVDGSDGNSSTYSMSKPNYVMIPDEETVATAKELMQAVLNGEVISQPEEE